MGTGIEKRWHLDPSLEKELLERAEEVQKNSYSPYSNFRVGAAILTEKGKIYTGTNVENASYGLTICAERVAVFKALSNGDSRFRAIAIVSDSEVPIPPCGACRQVLSEFSANMMVISQSSGGEVKRWFLKEIFPETFEFEKKD